MPPIRPHALHGRREVGPRRRDQRRVGRRHRPVRVQVQAVRHAPAGARGAQSHEAGDEGVHPDVQRGAEQVSHHRDADDDEDVQDAVGRRQPRHRVRPHLHLRPPGRRRPDRRPHVHGGPRRAHLLRRSALGPSPPGRHRLPHPPLQLRQRHRVPQPHQRHLHDPHPEVRPGEGQPRHDPLLLPDPRVPRRRRVQAPAGAGPRRRRRGRQPGGGGPRDRGSGARPRQAQSECRPELVLQTLLHPQFRGREQ
mmetsp:Transcript_4160/g.8845  ORF Transcript_4160/g.8845 Transcript_4160/m.8845 type:complete len:251 (+) Transcript_4160:167-919(+)